MRQRNIERRMNLRGWAMTSRKIFLHGEKMPAYGIGGMSNIDNNKEKKKEKKKKKRKTRLE